MPIKYGFGTLTASAVSSSSRTTKTERNTIILVSAKYDKRIYSMSAGYVIPPSGSAATLLFSGRLIVSSNLYNNVGEFIDPLAATALPDSLVGILFDQPVCSESGADVKRIERHWNFSKPIVVPKANDLSVILTFCLTDQTAYPGAETTTAFLTVNGEVAGQEIVYKDIR